MSKKVSKKERQEQLVANMRKWQRVENAAVAQTGNIIDNTTNPLIRFVAEVIQRDSTMHHKVQQLIIDSLTKESIKVSVDDFTAVWDDIEKHIAIEKQTITLAEESLAGLDHDREGVHKYLLEYLMADEQKHDRLLADLALIRKAMYP